MRSPQTLVLICMAPIDVGGGSGGGQVVTFAAPDGSYALATVSAKKKLPSNIPISQMGKVLTAAMAEIKADAGTVANQALKFTMDLDDGKLACLSLTSPQVSTLTSHGFTLLGVASWFAHLDQPFNYTDVQTTTDELSGKPMNTAMIYRTVEDLKARGFLEDAGRMTDAESGRPVAHYQISNAGREALKGAVLNTCILEKLQAEKVA